MINWFNEPIETLSPGSQFEIEELKVTENGDYQQKGKVWSKVSVDVEGGGSLEYVVPEQTVTVTDSPVVLSNVDDSDLQVNDVVVFHVVVQGQNAPNTYCYGVVSEGSGTIGILATLYEVSEDIQLVVMKQSGIWMTMITNQSQPYPTTYTISAIKGF